MFVCVCVCVFDVRRTLVQLFLVLATGDRTVEGNGVHLHVIIAVAAVAVAAVLGRGILALLLLGRHRIVFKKYHIASTNKA